MVTKKVETPSQIKLKNLSELYKDGKIDDAEKLAISISQQFPRHSFSWIILADLCRTNERMLKSLEYRKKLVEIHPQNASFHLDLANTMQVLDKSELAEESFKTALKLNPNFAEGHNNLGVLFRESRRFKEAEISFNKAIMLKADFAEAYNNLGLLMQTQSKLEEAKKNFEKALELNVNFVRAQNNLGIVLNNLAILLKEPGLIQDAKACFKKTLILEPNNDVANYNLGISKFFDKKFREALDQFKLIDSNNSKIFQLRCAFLLNEKSSFYKCLDYLIKAGVVNAVIGSHISRSEVKYGVNKHNPFCNDPLKYVLISDLNRKYDFDKSFIRNVKKILHNDNIKYRNQELLTNGKQTLINFFDQENDTINQIKKIIYSEIEKYRFHFKNSSEGFLKNFPKEYSLNGWLVTMKSGGKLKPHMHDVGWLSGSIYINVPPKLKSNYGNLVVCTADFEDQDKYLLSKPKKFLSFFSSIFEPSTKKNQKKIIDVVTGSLCLFPSSLLHHTIPFEAEEERIVLAFDVIKK